MELKNKKSYYIIAALIVIGFLNTLLLSGKRHKALIPEFLNRFFEAVFLLLMFIREEVGV